MNNAAISSFPDFGKLVPGFDFLQNLAKQAGSATQAIPQLPNIANWIAPTLNVEELDKRVQELKAVQFWLDQNAAALKATITALEVQKMTLATLKGGRTVIMIAHRLATIEQADQIIVLEKGCVSERGTLRELVTAGGLFTRLYSLQHRSAIAAVADGE